MGSAVETLEKLMPDMDPEVIHEFIARINERGLDPELYAEAMTVKAKQLDGCNGFFYKMVKTGKEDEWLSGPLKRLYAKKEKVVKATWPYPLGSPTCRICNGQGWYSKRRNDFDEVDEQMLDAHHMDGFEEVVMVHPVLDTERVVFICNECNPGGKRAPEFEGKEYPRYPLGGAPDPEPGVISMEEIF